MRIFWLFTALLVLLGCQASTVPEPNPLVIDEDFVEGEWVEINPPPESGVDRCWVSFSRKILGNSNARVGYGFGSVHCESTGVRSSSQIHRVEWHGKLPPPGSSAQRCWEFFSKSILGRSNARVGFGYGGGYCQ